MACQIPFHQALLIPYGSSHGVHAAEGRPPRRPIWPCHGGRGGDRGALIVGASQGAPARVPPRVNGGPADPAQPVRRRVRRRRAPLQRQERRPRWLGAHVAEPPPRSARARPSRTPTSAPGAGGGPVPGRRRRQPPSDEREFGSGWVRRERNPRRSPRVEPHLGCCRRQRNHRCHPFLGIRGKWGRGRGSADRSCGSCGTSQRAFRGASAQPPTTPDRGGRGSQINISPSTKRAATKGKWASAQHKPLMETS